MQSVGFDWDEGNFAKCQKHGVSIAEIEALFRTGPAIAPSFDPLCVEQRFIAVGRTSAGRGLFVAFTYRSGAGRHLIRPISARYMHAKEERRYAAQGPDPEDR